LYQYKKQRERKKTRTQGIIFLAPFSFRFKTHTIKPTEKVKMQKRSLKFANFKYLTYSLYLFVEKQIVDQQNMSHSKNMLKKWQKIYIKNVVVIRE